MSRKIIFLTKREVFPQNTQMISLLESTRALLERHLNAGKSLRQIARECQGVEYDWLKRFRTGDIIDPSVNRVQTLHDCLKVLKINT